MKFKKISALASAVAMMVSLLAVPVHAEATTYYSVTGYNVPTFLKGQYDSETVAIQDLSEYATTATFTVLDESNETAVHETTNNNANRNIIDGTCVGANGIADGLQLAWNATRKVVLDLKRVLKVDKVDIYTAQEGKLNGGSISAIKVYSGTSQTGPWTEIGTITPGTGEGYVTKNDNYTYFFQEGTLSSTVETRYIAVEVAHTNNVQVNHINVLSKTDPTPAKELTTYYPLTGYGVPAYIEGCYDAEETVIGKASGSVNYAEETATHYFTDTSGNGDGIYETPTNGDLYVGSKIVDGSLVDSTGHETNGAMLSFGSTRRIVVDLGTTKAVDKVDVYTAQEGTAGGANGKISAIKVYAGTSASSLTFVRSITPGTGTGNANTNGKQWFFQEGTFAETVNARYIAVEIAQDKNVMVNWIGVYGKTAPVYTPSWGSSLNVISNNTNNGQIVLPAAMITDWPELSGVTVTGSATTAKYKWLSGETSISDEETRDKDGYVIPSEKPSYPYPDLQDGGYGDGDSNFNTTNWGTIAGSMLWDLGEAYTLNRLDILTTQGADTYGKIKGAKISVSNDGLSFTTVVDKYNAAVSAWEEGKNRILVFDLNGAKARYVKVEFIGEDSGKNTKLGEMYIYGTPSPSASSLAFTNGADTLTEYKAGTVLKAAAEFNAAGGELIVGRYDSTMKTLKEVFTSKGTGTVTIDLSTNDFEVGDKLKAFAFDSLTGLTSLHAPTEIGVVSGE